VKQSTRPALTADLIVEAAIRIADEEGLDAVSIRRMAAELDARPMSLYDHIGSKEGLLSLMADEVVKECLVEPPLPEGWRDAMTMIARLLYGTLVGHPWLVHVFSTQPRFGPSSEKQAEQIARGMSGLPLESHEMWILAGTINDYVLGHSLRAVALAKPEALEDAIAERAIASVPELASLPEYLRTRAEVDRFEAGLELVLDGIERRVLGAG
jgi:AcrR family transcriptional regulator